MYIRDMKLIFEVPAITLLGFMLIWPVLGNEENENSRQISNTRVRSVRRGPQRGGFHNKQNASQDSMQRESAAIEDNDLIGQAVGLLHRLNDRFTGLQALDEQQLRRLETLEYRFTKLEVQLQEKVEGLRTELREVSRRVQQQEWQTNKMDTTLESIKLEITGLIQGQEHLRGVLSVPENRHPTVTENETNSKLQTLLALQVAIKVTTNALLEALTNLSNNTSQITNMTRMMVDTSNKLVTKQHLKNIFLDFYKSIFSSTNSIGNGKYMEEVPWDCSAIQSKGYNQSGIYRIQPPNAMKPFYTYCDMETAGGGWTVIQNRFEGTVDFNRGWEDYKFGFGNLGGEFWLGLEKVHQLTNYKVNELYIELTDFTFEKTYAHYSAFVTGNEIEGYAIQVLGGYEGDAGDSLMYHAGMKFSTYDMDNDGWGDGNCAESHTGAWWYNGCDTSNLNGRYLRGELVGDYEYQGIYWYDWHGPMYSLMKTRMSVRPSAHTQTHFNNNISKNRTLQEIDNCHSSLSKDIAKEIKENISIKNEDVIENEELTTSKNISLL